MHPILFEFGCLRIYSYGVMVTIGFLIAVYFASRDAARNGIEPDKIFDIGLYALVAGLIGARLLHVLLDFGYYSAHPFEIILINRGGLAFHGGLAAGICAAWLVIRYHRMPLWNTADIVIPFVALGQAIGRIGCLLNGCCYGAPTYLFFGIRLPGHLQFLHPTQLYLSLYLFVTFLILKKIERQKQWQGKTFFSYLLLYAFGRFVIDFFRGDLKPLLSGLTASQLISAAIFIGALISYRHLSRQ